MTDEQQAAAVEGILSGQKQCGVCDRWLHEYSVGNIGWPHKGGLTVGMAMICDDCRGHWGHRFDECREIIQDSSKTNDEALERFSDLFRDWRSNRRRKLGL